MTPKFLILHHTVTSQMNTTPKQILDGAYAKWGVRKEYHYLIGGSQAWRLLGDSEEGIHCYGHNFESIGVALCGNFVNDTPTYFQLSALSQEIQRLKSKFPNIQVLGHRDFNATTCPGPNLYKLKPWSDMKFINQELLSTNGVIWYNVKPDEMGTGNTIVEAVDKDTKIDSNGAQFAHILGMKARNKMNFSPTPIEWKDPKTLELENQVIDLKEKLTQKLADQDFIDKLKAILLEAKPIWDWIKNVINLQK